LVTTAFLGRAKMPNAVLENMDVLIGTGYSAKNLQIPRIKYAADSY
jgi:hypothetical protein